MTLVFEIISLKNKTPYQKPYEEWLYRLDWNTSWIQLLVMHFNVYQFISPKTQYVFHFFPYNAIF